MPSRWGIRVLFRMVKSTGWKGALPSPARAAATTSPIAPGAVPATSPEAAKARQRKNMTGRAPTRSPKPDRAWPTPEITKNTDTST